MTAMTDQQVLAEVCRLTEMLGEHARTLHVARARWQVNHFDVPLAIAVPESFAVAVVSGARFFDLPLVRANVAMPTLLVPATP